MGTPQEPLHGGLERVAHARGGKAMSGTRPCAQQGPAGDGKQPPLVPRSGSFPRLRPGVAGAQALAARAGSGALLAREANVIHRSYGVDV